MFARDFALNLSTPPRLAQVPVNSITRFSANYRPYFIRSMSCSIDSNAVFRARGIQFGLAAADMDAMEARGWKSMSTFAFSCSYVPGTSDDSGMKAIIDQIFGSPDHAKGPLMRRLFFESYTVTAADLRSKVERAGDEPPRRMAPIERAARRDALQTKLSGIEISDQYEPSNHLVDMLVTMYEDGVLRYISLEDCATREAEMAGAKKTKEWKPNSSGHLAEVIREEGAKAAITTDLRMMQAFMRRGIAMEIANLLDFTLHEVLVRTLLKEYQREPLPGFMRVSMDQVFRCDREVFRDLADLTRKGLQPNPRGIRPLDAHILNVLAKPSIAMLLLPTQGKSPQGGASKEVRRTDNHDENPTAKKKTKGKGKGKGSAKSQKPQSALPEWARLKGLKGNSKTRDGKPICYGYNLNECNDESCSKGEHVCTHCFKDHPFLRCPSRPKGGAA